MVVRIAMSCRVSSIRLAASISFPLQPVALSRIATTAYCGCKYLGHGYEINKFSGLDRLPQIKNMRTKSYYVYLLAALAMFAGHNSHAAVAFSVTPSAVSNTYNGT